MPHSAYHLPHPLSLHAQRKSLPLRRSGANFIIYSLTRRDDDNADYVPHGEWERERYRAGQKPFNSCNTNSNCEWNNCCASSWILCNSFNALAALPFERRRRLLRENELHFALCHGIKRCLGVSLVVASALLGGLSLPKQLAAILKVASRQINEEVDRHKAKQKSQNTKSFTHGKALAKLCHNAATTASKLPQLVVSLPSTLTR